MDADVGLIGIERGSFKSVVDVIPEDAADPASLPGSAREAAVCANSPLRDARDYWLAELDGDLPDTLPVDDAAARGADSRGAHVLRILPTEPATAVKQRASSSRRSVTALLYAPQDGIVKG